MPKFKAGKEYEVTLTVTVRVTPKETCNEADLEELAQETVESGAFEVENIDWNDCIDEDEDDEDGEESSILTDQDAKDVWVDIWNSEHRGQPCPELKPHQIKFIKDAYASGFQVRTYSGRGMFGAYCPGVTAKHHSALQTTVQYQWDNMGRDFILYAQ